MSDNDTKENLANARRKLKKFRDQQPNNGVTESSFADITYPSSDALSVPRDAPLSFSASEGKAQRDLEHYQEQLEVHVQTIGVLVAEKADLAAKLSQSFKQLERKQSEQDELYGRLKASRERVQELEKQMQNSTSDVQKREMAAKESDKENDRLKLENIRQSQLIEDLKGSVQQLNAKLQSANDQPIAELNSAITRLRSDNEQYQQSHSHMQSHIEELNDQIAQMQVEFEREKVLFQNAIEQWTNRYEDLQARPPAADVSSENAQLKAKIHEQEQTIAELQSETDKIGDYIQLYQQQREQLQKRYQEKDQLLEQLTSERAHFFRTSAAQNEEARSDLAVKLAFTGGGDSYLCSTCTGSVRWV